MRSMSICCLIFILHLSEPSRETGISASLIDHVITSKDTPVLRLLQTCGLSDHKVQIATLGCYTSKTPSRSHQIRSFRNCDWQELHNTLEFAPLQFAPWQVMSVYDDINDKWGYFYALLQGLNKFLPLKKVTSRTSKRPTP